MTSRHRRIARKIALLAAMFPELPHDPAAAGVTCEIGLDPGRMNPATLHLLVDNAGVIGRAAAESG